MDTAVFRQLLRRQPQSHKYDFGHVLIIGGAPGMVGAPLLAAKAALRVGSGLVTIASMAAVIDKLEKRVEELMTLRLSDDANELLPFIKDRKVSAVVVGPGMKPDFAAQVLGVIKESRLPVIVDGGALAAVQDSRELIRPGMVLTPHAGEFRRFFKTEAEEPSRLAADFAVKYQVTLVLKGHPTYVSSQVGEIFENKSGGPELATAGTGDVLSGIIGGIIAQKIEQLAAIQAAVYLHGLAGKLAAESKTEPGVIASDIIEAIPAALKLVLERKL